MIEQPKMKLSRLREIGWSKWDPVCLSRMGPDDWKNGGPGADEYDGYLLQVAGQLRRREPYEGALAYLEEIEMVHMGGGRVSTTRSRAEATVAAIADYLAELPAGPLKVRQGRRRADDSARLPTIPRAYSAGVTSGRGGACL